MEGQVGLFFRVSGWPRNYPLRAKERVGRGCLALSPELTVRGEGACLMGFVTSAPELSVGGESARRTRLVASAPELSVGGEGLLRTGLVVLAPELSVGGKERVGRDWLR